MQVRDLMMPSVLTASRGDGIPTVDRAMRDRGVNAVVVMDEQTVVGLFTDKELAQVENDGHVEDGMKPCQTIDPGASLEDAAKLMARERQRFLPVLDAGFLVGLISLSDIRNWATNASDDESQRIITLSLEGSESTRPRT